MTKIADLKKRLMTNPEFQAEYEKADADDPPPLTGSTLKYGFDHEGGPR